MWLVFAGISFVGLLVLVGTMLAVLVALYHQEEIDRYYKFIGIGFAIFLAGVLLAPAPHIAPAEQVQPRQGLTTAQTKADKDRRGEQFAQITAKMPYAEVIAIMGEGKVVDNHQEYLAGQAVTVQEIEWGSLVYTKIYKIKFINGFVNNMEVVQ
ncbi:MAG: hypothetical protein RSC56_04635 [Acidaminococcaceae bacterium]